MRGNDEHDPLDDWLGQQVRPLPPPPGTFELITRRARRRKIHRLAVTVGSAAAVAAVAVVIAVPGGLLLRVSPSPAANGVAAGRQTQPTSNGRSQVTGDTNRTPAVSPGSTNTTKPTPIASGFPEPLGPVPDNFTPLSVTFVSTEVGWVLGPAGTPGHCQDANPSFCTSVVRTDDAGKTWHGGPAPQTSQPNGPGGVSGIRFLDGVNGWAFGPQLWVTHNAGNSWYQIPTDGARVTDLETASGRAYALWAMCSGSPVDGFAADCTSYTLMTATADSDNWTPVGGQTNGLTDGGNATSAVLALTGSDGYLVAPDGTLYSGPIGGTWQKAGTVPCQPGPGTADGLPHDIMLALQNSTQLAVACTGPSFPAATVYTSDDGGANWTEQASAAWAGVARPTLALSLTSAPNGTLVLASSLGLDVLPAGGSQWQLATGLTATNPGFMYVGMTTDRQGVAVPIDTGLHEIWMTFDGGQTWTPATPITPGS
jgi:photosystem II stability/assembly factor-like uncharacterized protein